ncbi:site-specific integrase [Escherichia coli]|nr:site-specific integrase [Escherichia coli]
MAITDSWLKSNYRTQQAKVIMKSDRDGLNARVAVDGGISWVYRYRYNGKAQYFTFAHYPSMSLKEARELAHTYRGQLDQGDDPKLIRQRAREERHNRITVEAMFRSWHETYCKTFVKRPERILSMLEHHVFPELGSQIHEDVRSDVWCDLIERLSQKTPSTAYKVLSISKQVHGWASRRKMTAYQPLQGVRRSDIGITLTHRKRVLTDVEIVTLFNTFAHSRIDPKYKLMVKLCLLFACRAGELLFAHKSHFDFENCVWSIPPELHKNGHITGRPLVRPIIPAASELLQELFALSGSKRYVVTKKRSSEPLGESALSDIPTMLIKTAKRKLNEDVAHFSFHDLRRTARTNLSNLTSGEVAETMLGHVIPGVAKVYDHNQYLEEQRTAYGRWWAKVETLVYGDGKVTMLRVAR